MVECMQIGRLGMSNKQWIGFWVLGITFVLGSNIWLAQRDSYLFNELNHTTIQTND